MAAEIINDRDLWDRFIEESPYGMLFHRWDFLKIIEKHTGYDLRTYGVYEGRELIGVFPLFYKKTKGVKLVYSPPQGTLVYIPYMGLVMGSAYEGFKQRRKEGCLAMAWRCIDHELKGLSANFASITFIPQMDDVRPFTWEGYDVEVLYTYLFDLEQPLETMWNGFEKECKQNIKKAAQYGLSIKRTSDVDTFHGITAKGLESQGNTFFQRQGAEYIKDLMTAFPENLGIYFMYKDEEIEGVRLDCYYKGSYIAWCGGTVLHREIKTTEYFEWEMMKLAKAAGYQWYENWGGDMRRLNVHKSKFNPMLVPYYHVRKMDAVGRLSDWGYGVITSKPYLSFVKKIVT
jgi:hypothetical protein